MKHFNIKVFGLVQGVFYRKYAESKANEMQIKGFVKNEKDASVYIEAEADETTLKKFIEWCYTGSPNCRVDKIEHAEAALENFKLFEIRR